MSEAGLVVVGSDDGQPVDDAPELPPALAVLPLRETVPFPDMVIPLAVGQDRSLRLVDDVLTGDRRFVMVAGRDGAIEEPSPEQLYEVGVIGTIARMMKVPDGTSQLGQEFTVSDPTAWSHQSFDFDLAAGAGKLLFEVGGEDVCFDNVTLTVVEASGPEEPQEPALQGGVNLLDNGDFASDLSPWGAYANQGSVVGGASSGAYCATAVPGPDNTRVAGPGLLALSRLMLIA